jgi:ABC-2 type transport system permease protein
MDKIWLVAKREYLFNLRRRSFLLGAFGVPIFVLIVMFVAISLIANDEENVESVGQVGYVDVAGVLSEAIDRPEQFVAYSTEDEARQALDQGSLGAYFVVPDNYMETGAVSLFARTSIPEALHDLINEFLLTNLSADLDVSVAAERIQQPVDLTIRVLDSGRTLTREHFGTLFLTPVIFVIVFMMALQTTSGFLMGGIVEEKANRMMEILITSITPLQMLVGKVLGLGALGMTQILIWAAGGALLFQLGANTSFLAGLSFPTDILVISLVYFILAYFFVASLMAGIGAVVGSEQESRQIAGLFALVLYIPFFAFVTYITDPNGPLPTIFTLIPFTAPVSVILRYSLGAIPAWQLVASFVILAVSTMIVMWASARIFRWALLLYGKRPGLRELLRVIRQPRVERAVSQARAEEAV